jgi:hypothetical protein
LRKISRGGIAAHEAITVARRIRAREVPGGCMDKILPQNVTMFAGRKPGKQRIMAGIDDVNRHPVIHTWSYKLAEAA